MPTPLNSIPQTWRLPGQIVDQILVEVHAPLPQDLGRVARHIALQHRLKALGNRLGYSARLEHRTPRILNGRFGCVDVVWDAPDGGRSVAIEIDRSWRRKSITKLIHMAATYQPVWVFIGPRAYPFTSEECDLDRIHLIEVKLSEPPRASRARPAASGIGKVYTTPRREMSMIHATAA